MPSSIKHTTVTSYFYSEIDSGKNISIFFIHSNSEPWIKPTSFKMNHNIKNSYLKQTSILKSEKKNGDFILWDNELHNHKAYQITI